jgi:hypothetical protein
MPSAFKCAILSSKPPGTGVVGEEPQKRELLMNFASGKSITLRCLTVAGTLVSVACTSVMSVTPQQMSEHVIDVVKVDPKTDPNPQTLAFDQTACINKARLESPIVGVNEGEIMTGSMLLGAAGGAGSGAAAAAGTGHAGQAAAINSVGGAIQGGQNGLNVITNTYAMQMYQQSIHYGLCLEEHGYVVHDRSKQDQANIDALKRASRSDVGAPQVGPAPTSAAPSHRSLELARGTLLGVWRGSYVCAQGETGVELSFTDIHDDGVVSGTFNFFNLPGQITQLTENTGWWPHRSSETKAIS